MWLGDVRREMVATLMLTSFKNLCENFVRDACAFLWGIPVLLGGKGSRAQSESLPGHFC